jgi:hypothetical protein
LVKKVVKALPKRALLLFKENNWCPVFINVSKIDKIIANSKHTTFNVLGRRGRHGPLIPIFYLASNARTGILETGYTGSNPTHEKTAVL